MNIENKTKLLKLKGILNDISHASFSYNQLSRDYPMHELDDRKAQQMIKSYQDIIDTVNSLIMKYANENTTY